MVMVLVAQCADAPAGKPLTPVDIPSLEIPVAPVVACVKLVKDVLIHKVGVEEPDPAVFKHKYSQAPIVGVTARTVPSYWVVGIPEPVTPANEVPGLKSTAEVPLALAKEGLVF